MSAKGKVAVKAAKGAAKPGTLVTGAKVAVPAAKAGLAASKPLIRQQVRGRVEHLDRVAHTLGEVLTVYAPKLAYDLGLAKPPRPKRTAPPVAAGVVIGASAMYFLDPGCGKEHRQKVAQLLS
jgi:hypothetical protein